MKSSYYILLIFALCIRLPVYSQSGTGSRSDAEEAIKKMKKELKNDPGNTELRRSLADKYLALEEYDAVIDLYGKKFEKKDCSAGEYRLYAAARIRHYEKMVITAKLLSKLPGASLVYSDLSDAEEALTRVINKDSSDSEALFFMGVLRRVDGKEREAEDLFRRVMVSDPFFRSFVFDDPWLELGRLLRKQQRWKEANELLQRRAGLDSSDTWPMIELALSHIDMKNDEDATRMFYRGLARIKEAGKIERLYMEAEPIATKKELEEWKDLSTAEAQLGFLTVFWKSRDPNLVDAVNERLIEHYRRVQFAKVYYKKTRPPYFDDRGLVYVRMGPPDRRFAGTNDESWVYDSTGDHFDFVDVGQAVYEIRPLSDAVPLSESAEHRFAALYAMLDARRGLHTDYERFANRMKSAESSISPERNARQIMGIYQSSLTAVEQQLYTANQGRNMREKFDYLTGTEPVPINANFASFRSTNHSRLDFYYMIPVEKLKFMAVDNTYDKAFLSVKAKILDTTYREIHFLEREYRITQIDSTLQAGYFIIDELRSLLSPGAYLLALDIRNNLNEKIGIYKLRLHVRDYSLPQLMVSDIELSSSVSQQVIIDKFIKPDTKLRVVPNPAGLSLKSRPLTVYYEIYNLTLNNDGKSSYEVSYAIESASRKNIIARLFSGKSKVVSTTLKTGYSTTEREYIGFDISELPPGDAVLTVTVTDQYVMKSAHSAVRLKISP